MKVALCIVVKDEADYLIEWISYHLAIGFDQIVVYDNASTDGSGELLECMAGIDSRLKCNWWPDVPECSPQRSAYQDALRTIEADWIAFLDIDEFLVLKTQSSVRDFLATFSPETAAVSINWRHFGSSFRRRKSSGLVIERFLLCPSSDFFRNAFVKSIVRPEFVSAMSAHVPYLTGGEHRCADGQQFATPGQAESAVIIHQHAQVNHYVIRSRAEYRAKERKGQASRPPDDDSRWDKFGREHWERYDLNVERDEAILVYVPAVKELMESFSVCVSSAPLSQAEAESESARSRERSPLRLLDYGLLGDDSEAVGRVVRGARQWETSRIERQLNRLAAARSRLAEEIVDLRRQLDQQDDRRV